MALGILVLITALSISAVAIYYSIAGLVAIFAAAAIPIMIMGGVLEIGKLVTAVWLHRYWSQAKWWLKYYLATAVLVLMFITSMGIFGFLSKAHIEQTSAGEESVAQVQQIESEVTRLNAVIKRADDKVKALETSGAFAIVQFHCWCKWNLQLYLTVTLTGKYKTSAMHSAWPNGALRAQTEILLLSVGRFKDI